MKVLINVILVFLIVSISGCKEKQSNQDLLEPSKVRINSNNSMNKKVVYQVFTRLFGNTNTTNKPWGTIEENGVGKFNDFTPKALNEIKDLGVTHIWYTGVLHHALINDYTAFGISQDDPDVVKGRAGSPYAVKDYYNVNPDLAIDPSNRLQEFKELIDRTHHAGMKVIIDIVPNHVARHYKGLNNPDGIVDFGVEDDTTVAYSVNNNFYYNPGESFKVPIPLNGYKPLGGEQHPLADGNFIEVPAKWTGNGSRLSQPHFNDWYETVKVNYGISPDGEKNFPDLPSEFAHKDYKSHYEFWRDKTIPDSWDKFKDIAIYWLDFGVDGFRFDMAEMVPVEFWSYLNSSIKMKNEDAFLLAEVYNPALYRDYLHKGKMDYLYDKVQLYDTIKSIMQGHGKTDYLPGIQEELSDIEHQMLHFLENHDEQRIASPEFAGSAEKGKPAMVVSSTISSSPTMIYFGQELGEPANENGGFGSSSRTSIFDYVGVPHVQRWVNNKLFDGGQSTEEELKLRNFYKNLLNFTIESSALMGAYHGLHHFNREHTVNYTDKIFSFARYDADEKLIVVSNFDANNIYTFQLQLPSELIKEWNLDGNQVYQLEDQIYNNFKTELTVSDQGGQIQITLQPLESFILQLQ